MRFLDTVIGPLFCRIESMWLRHFVNDKTDYLVRFIDWYSSKCSYCTNVRSIIIGMALVSGFWIGLVLTAIVLIMVYGERRWLCDTPKTPPA